MAEAATLDLSGLEVRYGRSVALRDVSIHVPAGAIFALVGMNGAGNTNTQLHVGYRTDTTFTLAQFNDDLNFTTAGYTTQQFKLWDGILAVPLIGTLDSARTQVVMESLLQSIVDTGSSIAIVDITGVPTVDTLIAQNLLKTAAAARLMGAQCIICGIRPQIAQTMVHLGVAFGEVVTRATLADALAFAFREIGCTVSRPAARI